MAMILRQQTDAHDPSKGNKFFSGIKKRCARVLYILKTAEFKNIPFNEIIIKKKKIKTAIKHNKLIE